MRLRTKIFLSSTFLVVLITIGGFYLLNMKFSGTISDTIRKNFRDSRTVSEQIVKYLETELIFRSRLIGDLSNIKAAVSTRDSSTVWYELKDLPELDPATELYIIADTRNNVLAYFVNDSLSLTKTKL